MTNTVFIRLNYVRFTVKQIQEEGLVDLLRIYHNAPPGVDLYWKISKTIGPKFTQDDLQ